MGNKIKEYLKNKEKSDLEASFGQFGMFSPFSEKPLPRIPKKEEPKIDYNKDADIALKKLKEEQAAVAEKPAPEKSPELPLPAEKSIEIPGASREELKKEKEQARKDYQAELENLDKRELIEKLVKGIAQFGEGYMAKQQGIGAPPLDIAETDWTARRNNALRAWRLSSDQADTALRNQDNRAYEEEVRKRNALAKHTLLREKALLDNMAKRSSLGNEKRTLFNKMLANTMALDTPNLNEKEKIKLVNKIRSQAADLDIPQGVVQNALIDPEGKSSWLGLKTEPAIRSGGQAAEVLQQAVMQPAAPSKKEVKLQQIQALIRALQNPDVPTEKKKQFRQLLIKEGYLK